MTKVMMKCLSGSKQGSAGLPKKIPSSVIKKQDTLLMDTKLKIVEILEVRIVH